MGGYNVMNATEIVNQIKKIIDDLWAEEITKQDAVEKIAILLKMRENRLKVLRGKEKSAVFVRIMGIKRMKTFDELFEDMNI